jgi:Fe-Mn family superoxide dismutase
MPLTLPPLPYDPSALEPHLSKNTFSFHYDRHHKTYVDNLNNLIKGSDYESCDLMEIILKSHAKQGELGIFNNAAQVWNHTFFWHSMKPNGGGKPYGSVEKAINSNFGSYEAFAAEFKKAALAQFGSGWVWLVAQQDNKLKIVTTSNASLPMISSQKAVITCDLWEHAYYLDYQNRRGDFVQTFLDNLLNWDFAISNFENS